MSKRPSTIDGFFKPPPSKKVRSQLNYDEGQYPTVNGSTQVANISLPSSTSYSTHQTYPFALPHLPPDIIETLNFAPAAEGRIISEKPDLDLVYYQPYIPKEIQRNLFEFLRRELFFYRVKYRIKRGTMETEINTPRFTTVFGLDETARFNSEGEVVDAASGKPVSKDAYQRRPRPIPECLDLLRRLTENTTGCKFNFALVNYYSSGADSISYHSDDERFLGPEPAIASFTLGAMRDFLLRRKKTPAADPSESKPLKFELGSGDMMLMKGKTQSCWEHSIPKRKGGEAERGRINITFRRAMVKGGTNNYYKYNVGDGGALKWDENRREMMPWSNTK